MGPGNCSFTPTQQSHDIAVQEIPTAVIHGVMESLEQFTESASIAQETTDNIVTQLKFLPAFNHDPETRIPMRDSCNEPRVIRRGVMGRVFRHQFVESPVVILTPS